jgi:hypothetical protein
VAHVLAAIVAHSGAAAPPVPDAVPAAWLGRTSTEDAQDPTISLPRQLRNSRDALPDGFVIVAHFYDVESGRKDLADRGRGHAHERLAIPVPRDGGIADLLEEAARPDRRVRRRGVRVDRSAKRATPILTRRVKQAIAEWYVLRMLELSWDGFCTHTDIRKSCYGYQADKIPYHPARQQRPQSPDRGAERASELRIAISDTEGRKRALSPNSKHSPVAAIPMPPANSGRPSSAGLPHSSPTTAPRQPSLPSWPSTRTSPARPTPACWQRCRSSRCALPGCPSTSSGPVRRLPAPPGTGGGWHPAMPGCRHQHIAW